MLIKRGHQDYARSYRPFSYNELFGQEEIKQIIMSSFSNDSVSHSYLFHGASGTGKTTCARIIGMGLLCEENPLSIPCGRCQPCQDIMNGWNTDYREINNADVTQIDKMRELKNLFHCYPMFSKYKVFVFDECHRLSPASQNMLLKEIEEPPDFTYFIFCSTNPTEIIEPLRNRCMSIEFKLVTVPEIKSILVDVCDWENLHFSFDNLMQVVKKAGGKPRNALFELQKAVATGKIKKNGYSKIYSVRNLRGGGRAMVVSLSKSIDSESFMADLKRGPSVILGFHSLKELQSPNSMLLSLNGESIRINTPFKPVPKELIALIRGCKADIIRILSGHGKEPDSEPDPESPKPPPSPSEAVDPVIKKVAPVIVSASRRTDIPAFHSEWLFNRLAQGYLDYTLPYGGKLVRVSLENTRMMVFWTKNPAPMMDRLEELDQRGIGYYFQFTLNDYENEGLEPNLPSVSDRIDTFRDLAGRTGKGRVIWRFDPLILTDPITPEILIERVESIAERLSGHTEKLVFSFFKSGMHKKVDRKLARAGIQYRDFSADEAAFIAKELGRIGKEQNLTVAACAEYVNLSLYGIERNKCIDDTLIEKVFSHDIALMNHLAQPENLSAPGQRKTCQCIDSEDIGQYSTCQHNCLYCYANTSEKAVEQNFKRIDPTGEILLLPKKSNLNRVQDWSSKTVNCCSGCSNGCLYCYARGEAVLRFGRLTDEEWKLGTIRKKDVNKKYPKFDQTVMFPSTHDITWDNFEACYTVFCKLVKVGNNVLLVSKPRPELISILCDDFERYKGQIAFRFTVGARNDEILSFWEPGAPSFEDRKKSLTLAHSRGFRTSVSMEPMLDLDNVFGLIHELRPFVNWRIWIGTMNHSWYIKKYTDPDIDAALSKIEEGQTKERLRPIYDRYKDDPLIRFKSDFLKKLGLPPNKTSEDWPEG